MMLCSLINMNLKSSVMIRYNFKTRGDFVRKTYSVLVRIRNCRDIAMTFSEVLYLYLLRSLF